MSHDALRIPRPLSVIAVLAVAWALSGVTLSQQAASITLDPGSGPPGTTVTVNGTGFPSNTNGLILWDSQSGTQIGTFSANSNSFFVSTAAIPANASATGHTIWACAASPKAAKAVCASTGFKVTEALSQPTLPPLQPATRVPPTPMVTDCEARGLAGEVVINFESYASGTDLRETTTPEGVRFLGDSGMIVVSPAVATHSGTKALTLNYPEEFGSTGTPMRIGFSSLQNFVGLYVGLNQQIWSTSPITAVLTAYSLDASGHRVVAGTDSETFGPAATPIRKCLSVRAPGIFEITVSYGTAAEPEIIDDLTLRGPTTPVPLPGDDQPPRVTILQPEAGATLTDSHVRLQGEVREDRELVRMNYQLSTGIFHDLAFTPAGTTPEGDRLYLFALEPLPVDELATCGENTIQVRAFDSSDNMGGDDRTFRWAVEDLSVRQAEPVQVVYGGDLVQGKSTAFRVEVDSCYAYPVETMFRLELPEDEWRTLPPSSGRLGLTVPAGWEFPELWGPVTIPAGASGYPVMLPYIPADQEDAAFDDAHPAGLLINPPYVDADGEDVKGPDVRVVPRPTGSRASFAVEIDPANSITEGDEGNNRWVSPDYRVVATRPMCFLVVPVQSGGRGPQASILNIRPQIEFLLATFPLADSKVTWKTAPVHTQACPYNSSQDCSWAITDTGDYLSTAATMARASGCDYALAIGSWGAGGSTPMGFTGGATIGQSGWDALLAHEFNHSMTSVGDVYSLDCLVEWDEFYCEYPDGHREYYCQTDGPRLPDGYTGLNCRLEGDAIVCEEQTKQCAMYTGCSIYRRTEACSPADVPTCDRACAEATVVSECAGSVGHWSGPDCRIFHPSSEGFWVNRWLARDSSLPYIADCGSAAMWMRLENTGNHCVAGVEFADGYRNMLANANFVTGADPEALLVRGTIHKSGDAELEPFLYLPEANLDRAPGAPGAYRMALYDAQGTLLSQTGFDVVFEQSGVNGGPTDHAHFVMRIDWKPGTQRVALEDGTGRTLAEMAVTPHAPQIELTSPKGGEAWTLGVDRNLRWTASDEDGDTLIFFIDISSDGGKTWRPVAVDLTSSTYAFDTSSYRVGTAYLLRVRASDGVNTTAAVSAGPFTFIAAKPWLGGTPFWIGLVVLAVAGLGMLLLAVLSPRLRRRPREGR